LDPFSIAVPSAVIFTSTPEEGWTGWASIMATVHYLTSCLQNQNSPHLIRNSSMNMENSSGMYGRPHLEMRP
jgi:hypothetical protein